MNKWLLLTAWDSGDTKLRLCFGPGGVVGYARLYTEGGEPFTQLWTASAEATWRVSEVPEDLDALLGIEAEPVMP